VGPPKDDGGRPVKIKVVSKAVWLGPLNREVECPEGTLLGDLLASLGIENTSNFLIAVNGRTQDIGTLLHEGDEVLLLPGLSGG